MSFVITFLTSANIFLSPWFNGSELILSTLEYSKCIYCMLWVGACFLFFLFFFSRCHGETATISHIHLPQIQQSINSSSKSAIVLVKNRSLHWFFTRVHIHYVPRNSQCPGRDMISCMFHVVNNFGPDTAREVVNRNC